MNLLAPAPQKNPSRAVLEFLRTATPVLRAIVAQYRETLPRQEFEDFIGYLRHLAKGYAAELRRHPPGPERARAIYRLIDDEIGRIRGVSISCSRGCGACCHLEVEITRAEGELLADLVVLGHPIDRARLEEQASRERGSSEWMRMVTPKNRCVFLDDEEACSVYENRPAVCRKALIATPPAACAEPGARTLPVTVPLAELILSVALSEDETPTHSLAKSVLAALRRRESG